MKIPTICRYCGGKIIKSTTRALYPKGSEPIYLCVNCNAYVWDTLPKNMFRVVSRDYPTLKFCLTALIKDDNSVLWDNELTLREYMIANGRYMGSYRRNETDAFAQIREGMGFQP